MSAEKPPLSFYTVISSEGIGVRGAHPDAKWHVAVPRCDMGKSDTAQIVRANIARVVAASEKRERKAVKRQCD